MTKFVAIVVVIAAGLIGAAQSMPAAPVNPGDPVIPAANRCPSGTYSQKGSCVPWVPAHCPHGRLKSGQCRA